MTRLLLFILLGLVPGSLLAQTVTVRSGEHGDFTRLVFDVPPGIPWTLEQDRQAQAASLAFDVARLGFDVSRVFDRIDRSRLESIAPAQDGTSVSLSLACICDVKAFVLRERMLVIDIRPSTSAPGLAERRSLDIQQPPGQATADLASDLSQVRVEGIPGIGPIRTADPLLPRLPAGKPPASRSAAAPSPGERQRDMSEAVAIGDQIAADLAAAATEGILTAAVVPKAQEPSPAASGDRQPPLAEAQSKPDPDLVEQLAAGLSHMDHSASGGRRIQVGGLHCVSDELLRIADWIEDDTDINHALAKRRGMAFGEFDRIDEAALGDYAKALLYYGFGAEARATLDLKKSAASGVLRALSYLMDQDPEPTGQFRDQTNCPGDAALWSVIALPQDPGSHLVDASAVLRGYEKLPDHLREHLGPVLANRLSGTGYPDAARDVLNRLQRSKGIETDSIALGRAQLDLHQGDLDAAEASLRGLATEGGPESAGAILASIELARTAGKPVPGYLVELAEAFSVEFRNSDEGPEFWKGHITSLILNGSFQEAQDRILGADEAYVPTETIEEMRHFALESLVDEANDPTFLKLALRELRSGFRPKGDVLVLRIARRILALGLPDAALSQLAMIPSGSSARTEAAVLRAEALLELGRHEEAEIILIGQTGEEVTRLRAELRDRMGDHELAGSMYSELGEDALARQAAWLSGNWTSVADGSEDALAQAAAMIQTPPDSFDPGNPSLAMAEGLSESSVDTRATIRALLEATRLSEE